MATADPTAPAEAHPSQSAEIIPFPRRTRRRLSDADEALVSHLQDAHAGMAWWSALSPAERLAWLNAAGSAEVRDAWEAYKAGNSAV